MIRAFSKASALGLSLFMAAGAVGAQRGLADSALFLSARAESASTAKTAESKNSAVERWLQAAQLYREISDTAASLRLLYRAANLQQELGRNSDALVSSYRALALARVSGDKKWILKSLRSSGVLQLALGHADSAQRDLREAYALADELGTADASLSIRLMLGVAYAAGGKIDPALRLWREALLLARAAHDRASEISLLTFLGGGLRLTGQTDSAMYYFDRALALERETGDARGEAGTLMSIGLALRDAGKPDSSMVMLQASATILHRLGDSAREAQAIGRIGSLLNDKGERDSALALMRRSVRILQSAGGGLALAQQLVALGTIAQELGMLDSALANFRLARETVRATSLKLNAGAYPLALAGVFRDLGQPDSVLAYGREALELTADVSDPAVRGAALALLSSEYLRVGRTDSALVLARNALAITRETKSRVDEPDRLVTLGTVLRVLRQTDAARDAFRQSRELARELGHRSMEAGALYQLAELASVSKKLPSARALYDTAASLASTLRANAGNDFSRTSIAEAQNFIFEQWMLAWAGGGLGSSSPFAALAAAERGRAKNLLDLLRRETSAKVGGDLVAEGRQLAAYATSSGATGIYFATTPDTLLIWVIAPAAPIVLVKRAVNRDTLASLVTALHRDFGGGETALVASARGLRLELRPRPAEIHARGAQRAWDATARDIGAIVLPPEVLTLISGARELVIFPQGALAMLPFALLPTGKDGASLQQHHAIRYATSLATLAEEEARPVLTRTRGAAHDLRKAVVVGDPNMPSPRTASGERELLAPLPGARAEAADIAQLLGTHALFGTEATESEVRRRMPRASIVHLATHGFAFSDAGRARNSFVALAPDSSADGILTVGEILDAPEPLTADLVVLSACQTGLGNLRQAEGTVGLQRAFLAKGARTVLVSLWNVSDQSTRKLMSGFYRHWLSDSDHPSKAESLKRAQGEVRRTPGWENPKFWAAFQLVGAR